MKNLQDTLTILDRLAAPTPTFFKKLQAIGIVLAAIGGALMSLEANGIELPSAIQYVANWSTIIAGVITAMIGQLTVDVEAYKKENALR